MPDQQAGPGSVRDHLWGSRAFLNCAGPCCPWTTTLGLATLRGLLGSFGCKYERVLLSTDNMTHVPICPCEDCLVASV